MEKLNKRLDNLISALQLEKQSELDLFKMAMTKNSIQERVDLNQTLYPLDFLGINFTRFGDSILDFKVGKNQLSNRFSNGALVQLFNADGESDSGIVYKVKNEEIRIKIDFYAVENWINKGKLGLNVLPDVKTYDMYLNGLKSIQNSDFPFQIKQIYGAIDTEKYSFCNYKNSLLNESQNKAIQNILCTNTTIIHGPPGTGKTTTIVEAISELITQGKKIIVCAPTNTAVDNVALKLLSKQIKCCRIGNPIKIDAVLENNTLDGLAQKDRDFKLVQQLKKQAEQLRKKAFKFKRNFGKDEFIERKQLKHELKQIRIDIKKIQKEIYQNVLEKSDVICGTFISVLSENLKNIDFDYTFVDEAAQAIEPAIWSMSKLAPNLVLAGDHFQLPPFVQSKKVIKLGLDMSILEQAKMVKFPSQMLQMQYRMNQKIMNFSNEYFYESKLMAHYSVKNQLLNNEDYEPIEFIDTAGCGFDEVKNEHSNGIKNPNEANILIKRLNEINIDTNSVGIISPYRFQVNEIKSKCSFDVNTIDSFQGQEKDLIIISLVRINDEGEIGFLKDYRRMNVAMTRAKKKLIIIGDSATIGQDKFYGNLLDYIEKNGSYRSAWEFLN